MRVPISVLALSVAAAACGGGDSSGPAAVTPPPGATFCSVFTGEYADALADAVPITDDGFEASIGEIVAWAAVLTELAPAEISSQAADNLAMHRAQAAVKSAAEFIPGSNEMHAWANENC